MKKKMSFFMGFLLFLILLWYFFIKPYDYLVTIKTRHFPALINKSIISWGNSFPNLIDQQKNGLFAIKQLIQFNDSIHSYEWKILPDTDSTSRIKIYITDMQNSFWNKLAIPFNQNNFEKRTLQTVQDFTNKLKDYTDFIKISVVGEGQISETNCACVTLEGPQTEKAFNMMKNYTLLNDFIISNEIELNGKPFIEVTDWNIEEDYIYYNFCYPVLPMESFPENPIIKHKFLKARRAIKAIYNGNYISSDLGWYKLLDYANSNDIDVENFPVEIFYNNPNVGGDELNWKAEIYLPIKP